MYFFSRKILYKKITNNCSLFIQTRCAHQWLLHGYTSTIWLQFGLGSSNFYQLLPQLSQIQRCIINSPMSLRAEIYSLGRDFCKNIPCSTIFVLSEFINSLNSIMKHSNLMSKKIFSVICYTKWIYLRFVINYFRNT